MSASDAQQNTTSRPIAEAAWAVGYFEQSRIHRSRAETRLGEALLRHDGGRFFQAAGVSATVRNYSIANATFDADTGLLFQDRLLIPETSYFVPKEANGSHRAGVVSLDNSEDIVIGFNNAHAGYQHWLTQCVPAIDWSLRQKRTKPVRVLLPVLAPWQEEILNLLGHGSIPRLTLRPNMLYTLSNVEYSEFLNGSTGFSICLSVRDTARRLVERLPVTQRSPQVLYVPCTNPYYGTIRNEDEVIELLRRRGVVVVDQERLPAPDRMSLFRNADVVIGPLGQALSDVLFCRPGALLWEWMPRHFQNASFNCLAQAAEVDYWGDLFESVGPAVSDPAGPREWLVDVNLLARRLSQISSRLAIKAAQIALPPSPSVAGKPIEDVLLAFESLGDNCEFGLVQRQARIEPLGLFRFTGMSLPKMVAALGAKLDGIGTTETIKVYPAGENREYMVHETWLDTRYHTWISEGQIDPEELRKREAKRLSFLRRKMLEDLAVGEKIWVWREGGLTDPAYLQPLLRVLRGFGPNILLWVVPADEDHPAGTVERLDRDFIRGYVERLAPYENAGDIRPLSWFETCENALNLCRPEPAPPEMTAALPQRPSSAMEFLALNQAPARLAPTAVPAKRGGLFRWLWRRRTRERDR
jgi:Glycosyltransferase 61